MPTVPNDLSALVAELARGETPAATRLTVLSDLDDAGAEFIQSAWPSVPLELRRSTLTRLKDLADDSVDLDLTAVGRAALSDADASVRRAAIEALWESTDRHVGQQLANVARSDPDESVRAAAASGLSAFVVEREFEAMDRRVGDAIVDALGAAASNAEPSVDVRACAIESLAPRSLPWVATLISDAYYHEDRRLRIAAVRAMGSTADDAWLEFLDEQSTSEDPEFRFEAANSLGELASEGGVDILSPLLADEDTEVVLAALTALGEIGGDVAVDRLREFLREAEGEAAEVAREALATADLMADQDLIRSKVGL